MEADDSFHSPTVTPPSALDKSSIMKRYHRRRTCSHTSPRRSPTVVTLHDTGFVALRLDSENCRHLTVVGLHDTGPRSSSLILCLNPVHPRTGVGLKLQSQCSSVSVIIVLLVPVLSAEKRFHGAHA